MLALQRRRMEHVVAATKRTLQHAHAKRDQFSELLKAASAQPPLQFYMYSQHGQMVLVHADTNLLGIVTLFFTLRPCLSVHVRARADSVKKLLIAGTWPVTLARRAKLQKFKYLGGDSHAI